MAVLLSLLILIAQMRHGTRALEESNRLERASALDRRSDSIRRWRGCLVENEDLMRIWEAARKGRCSRRAPAGSGASMTG